MITIKSVEQIKQLEGTIYVRWSQSISMDKKRGYSLAYGTKRERGLSACVVDKSWDTWRILRQLGEYRFCGNNCWIVTGDEIGRGEDNEELLDNITLIGKVSFNLIEIDWLKMWRDEKLAEEKNRNENSSDDWNREYSKKMIEKYESSDRSIWKRILYSGS